MFANIYWRFFRGTRNPTNRRPSTDRNCQYPRKTRNPTESGDQAQTGGISQESAGNQKTQKDKDWSIV